MTVKILVHVKHTKKVYGGHLYVRTEEVHKLYEAMSRKLTRWQRVKCWLGIDAFPSGRVDSQIVVVEPEDPLLREQLTNVVGSGLYDDATRT